MRRPLTFIFICLAVVALGTVKSASADDSMMSGTAMPKNHAFLLGSWSCTVNLPAMMGAKASTGRSTLTISASPNMTVHSHVSSPEYVSDSYQGYDMKTKTHWLITADTTGEVASETSKDGVTFMGMSWMNGTSTPVRDVETKISDTKIRDVTSLKMGGKWTMLADATCTKP